MSIGAPASAAGALYQGEAQQAALEQQAAVQRANAKLDLEKGSVDAARSQTISGGHIANIEASAGAAGVTQSGSVLDVLGASAKNAELDRLNILHGAQVRSVNAENQASMDDLGASSAMKGAYMSAFGSLLSGGAQSFGNTKGGGSTKGDEYTDGQAQRDIDAEDAANSAQVTNSAVSTEGTDLSALEAVPP